MPAGCCVASRHAAVLPHVAPHCFSARRPLALSSHHLVVALPLVNLSLRCPSCSLIAPAGCHIASPCPLVVPPSRCLVAPDDSCIASCCPLVAPPSHPLIVLAGCCIASPPSHLLSAPADCRIASRRPLVAPPSCSLIAPAGCCVVSPCVTLSSSHRAGWLLSYLSLHHPLVLLLCCPLTAPAGCCVASVKRCRGHRTPSNATTTAATNPTTAATAIVDPHLCHRTVVHCQIKRQ